MPAGWLSRSAWALAALCLIAFGVMCTVAFNFFLAGKWYLADVGNIQYCLINTWQGRFMWSPLEMANHFGLHFTPFLLLLMPIVWLSPYPIPLVMFYQAALALTPIPIYVMARQRGLPGGVAVAAGFWFVCNHFLGSLQIAEHFESFYVLFALCAMAAIYGEHRAAWLIFSMLALSVKEDATFWLLGFAVWAIVFEKEPLVRRRAWRLGGICIAWAIVAAAVMAFCAQGQVKDAISYFERMNGFSVGADNTLVLVLLVASCGALCLLNWRAALLLFVPLPVILGNFEFTRHLLYYYSYPFLPFMAFATVAGLGQIWNLGVKWRRSLAPVLTGFLVLVGAVQYPLPTRTDGYRRLPLTVTPRDVMRRHIASDILPRDVPLALQFGLWGVTPWRADTVFLNPSQLKDHHYVFMDLYGIHGLSAEDNRRVLTRLRDEVEAGKRRELFDAYDFLILSPANQTSVTLEGDN